MKHAIHMLCLLLLAWPATTSTIDSFAPADGVPGTVVVIEGANFGIGKPRVWLDHVGSKRRHRLKVLSHTSQRIEVEVRRAKQGFYKLRVRPKGFDASVSASSFRVRQPEIVGVSPTVLAVGDTLEIEVNDLGQRKPRVWVGKRRAVPVKVDDSRTVVRAVVRGPPGLHVVQLNNRVGSGATGSILVVAKGQPLPSSPQNMELVLDGVPRKTMAAEFSLYDDLRGSRGRFQHDSRVIGMSVLVPVDLAGDFPQTWSGDDDALMHSYTSCMKLPHPQKIHPCALAAPSSISLDPTKPWEVTVFNDNGQQLRCIFFGTLGLGAQTQFAEGSFVVDLPDIP